MSGLSRELLKWLQTLDLPLPVKQPKRDLTNGYLFGEIVARYWQGVELHSLENKLSRPQKEANWKIMKRVFVRNNFRLTDDHILAIIECKDGAAQALLESLYTYLTRRQIQHAAPLQDAEVPVPAYERPQEAFTHSSMLQKAPSVQPEPQEEEKPKENENEKKAQERAQRRAAANRPKPKPQMKQQAIKAATDEQETTAPLVQFGSNVTVKALPPHMLSRFGAGGAHGENAPNSSQQKIRSGNDPNETVHFILSKQIEKVLADTNAGSFPLSGSTSTSSEYFCRGFRDIDIGLKNLMWSALNSGAEETASWILSRPLDFSLLLGFSKPIFDSQSAPDVQKSIQHLASIIVLVCSKSPTIAASLLKIQLLPFFRSDLFGPVHSDSFALVCSLIRQFLAQSTGNSDITAPVFSAIHDFMCAGPPSPNAETPVGTTNLTGDGYVRFLCVLERVTVLSTKSTSHRSKHNLSEEDVGAEDKTISNESLASVGYYNCVSGLHSESATVRAAAIHLLSTLTSVGRGRMLFDSHLDILRKQFNTMKDATVYQGSSDEYLSKVNLLVAAVTAAPSVFQQLRKELETCETELETANESGVEVQVTEPSQVVANEIAAQDLQAQNVTAELNSYLQNLIFASTDPVQSLRLSRSVRLHLLKIGGSALRNVSDQEISSRCAERIYQSVSKASQEELACLFGVDGGKLAVQTTLFAIPRPEPAQCSWPLLYFVHAHAQNLATQIDENEKTADFESPAAASKYLVSVLNELSKNGQVKEQSDNKMLETLFVAVSQLHTFCVKERKESSVLVYQPNQRNTHAVSEEEGEETEESNDEITNWWEIMRIFSPVMTSVVYAAETLKGNAERLESQVQAATTAGTPNPAEEASLNTLQSLVQETLDPQQKMCTDLMVRFYIDLSGVPMHGLEELNDVDGSSTSLYTNKNLISKAVEWFHTVVTTA